jgi:hypothetical protein
LERALKVFITATNNFFATGTGNYSVLRDATEIARKALEGVA